MFENFLFADELALIIISAFIGGWLTHYFTLRQMRKEIELRHQEEKYSNLIRYFRAYYETTDEPDYEMRQNFLDESRQVWLYAPDEVILNLNDVFNRIRKDNQNSLDEKTKMDNEIIGKFILSMRKDCLGEKFYSLKKTKLSEKNFEYFHLVK